MAARKTENVPEAQLRLRIRAAQLELEQVEARRNHLRRMLSQLDRQLIAALKAKHSPKK